MSVLGRVYIFLRVNFQVGTYCVRNGPRKGEGILFWMMEYPYEIAAMILPVQVLLAGFYFHRKYPPLRQSRIFASVIAEFPKVKDTTSIPRGPLLNRYSRRAG